MNSVCTTVWGLKWGGRGYEQCMHYSLRDISDDEEVMNCACTTVWGLKWWWGYEQCIH